MSTGQTTCLALLTVKLDSITKAEPMANHAKTDTDTLMTTLAVRYVKNGVVSLNLLAS